MSANRPAIPESTKRRIRQRCGFGCVMCGLPLYHYDHIDEYSVNHEHDEANITLLCAMHHDLKTRKHLPAANVKTANERPHNRDRSETPTHGLYFGGTRAEIVAGGNLVVADRRGSSAIQIDGHSLIDFEMVDGALLLNIDLRDTDGTPILAVKRNELVHSTHLWDYKFEGQRLTIRRKPGDFYASVQFDAPNRRVTLDRGLLSHNGVEVYLTARGLCILNNRTLLSGNGFLGMNAALAVGDDPGHTGPIGIHIGIPRGPFDRDSAVAWAKSELAKLPEPVERLVAPPPARRAVYFGPVPMATWFAVAIWPFPWQ